MDISSSILEPHHHRVGTRWYSLCLCSCGRTFTTRVDAAKSGVSCGCSRRGPEAQLRGKWRGLANLKRTANYRAMQNRWHQMVSRCYDKNSKSYPYYGGVGVSICEEWLNSFEAYYADMGEPPFPEASIDRIDNNGPYCKENCRWATKQEQALNRSSGVNITIGCMTLSGIEWAALIDKSSTTIYNWNNLGIAEQQIANHLWEIL